MLNDPPSHSSDTVAWSGAVTVQWFSAAKGFGFVAPDDGSPAAFCDIATVRRAGHLTLTQGAKLICAIKRDYRGAYVAKIHSVDASTANSGPVAVNLRQASAFLS